MATWIPPETRRLRAACAALSLAALAGCVADAKVLRSDQELTLASDQGALVIEAEGPATWDALEVTHAASGTRMTLRVETGEYALGAFQVPAGEYTVDKVHLPMSAYPDRGFKQAQRFTITAGKLNYLGALGFRFDTDGMLWHRWHNTSGRMLTELRAKLPAALAKLPVVYVGDDGDDWTSEIAPTR
jgi:hypothetical protein